MPSFIRRLSIRRKSISRRLSLNDRTRASLRKNKDIQKFGVSSIILISMQVRFGSDLYYGGNQSSNCKMCGLKNYCIPWWFRL